MSKTFFAVGALMCAAAVAAGAFGAHGLAARLDARGLELWETASRYFMYAGFGTLICGLATPHLAASTASWAGTALIVGGVIFSGSVGALALGAPRVLGAVAPIGGSALILGFVLLAWSAWSA